MPRRRDTRGRTARLGELLAATWLRLKGYRVVERNWRCKVGELDLVCRRGDMLVFVEVRTRRNLKAGTPESSIDRRKQEQVARVARVYLQGRGVGVEEMRFDVVAVGGGWPPIRHLRGAFRAVGFR